MGIRAITADITQLTLLWKFNVYLVREDDGLTLIDTALPFTGGSILAALRGREPLRRIVLTHGHYDHASGLDQIHAAFPEAELLLGEREARLYRQAQQGLGPAQFALDPDEPQTPVKGKYTKCTTPVSRTFADGEHIGSLRAVFTPGHTPGHMSFFDERSGTILSGDALIALTELRVVGDGAGFGVIGDWFTWHRMIALQSALRIAMLNPEHVACAHGPVISENVKAKLADALDHAGRKFAHD